MPDDTNKEKLLRFLERRAWNPILKAPAKQGDDRLERVQRKTEDQRERYRSYSSAGEVLKRFKEDLHSRAAANTNTDLKALKLPAQPDIAGEFFALAERLHVEPEKGAERPHKPHPPHPWHKSKPKDREKAATELKKEARRGDAAAIQTMKKAPAKWAREYAGKVVAAKRHTKKSAPRKVSLPYSRATRYCRHDT